MPSMDLEAEITVKKESSRNHPAGNNDRNQEQDPENKRTLRTCINGVISSPLWCAAVMPALVNCVLQENIFSLLYLGILSFMVLTSKQKPCILITMKILCGLLWTVVVALKIAFQVLYCNENKWALQHAFDLPIFGVEISRQNNTYFTKSSCPLDNWYKDILLDSMPIIVFILLLPTTAIACCCKFKCMKEKNTRFMKCDEVARQFMDKLIVTNPDTNAKFGKQYDEDLNKLCEAEDEEKLLSFFRDDPVAKDTKNATNKQQAKDSAETGAKRGPLQRVITLCSNLKVAICRCGTGSLDLSFNNHYCMTLLRTFHALSGVNLQVASKPKQNQPVARKSEDGQKRTSVSSHTSTSALQDGAKESTEPQEGPNVALAGRNTKEQGASIVEGRNAKEQGAPIVEGRNAEEQGAPIVEGRNAEEQGDSNLTGRNAEPQEGSNKPQNESEAGNGKCITGSKFFFCFASVWPIVCYILMIVYTTLEGNVLSIVYPGLIFFWALLTSGRCHIWFWIAVTLYTLALIIAKNLFKWSFISWNTEVSEDIFYSPRIIGLEKSSDINYLTMHPIILLEALFIQCCIFKYYGTWDTPQQVKQENEKRKQGNEQRKQANEQKKQGNEKGEQSIEQRKQGSEQQKQGNEQVDLKQDDERPAQSKNTEERSVPSVRTAPDLYWCALLCDTIIFLIILMWFSMPAENGNLIVYLLNHSVPWPYLCISVGYFLLIPWERILYIWRSRLAKFISHMILMLGVHVAVFFALPFWHQKSFNQIPAAQAVYFFRCLAFAMSAYQIKNGYPRHEHVHVSTKSYSRVHKFIFSVYLFIPFLMEIRTLLGWIFTKTCLSRRQWFQCEDIYTSLYKVKCDMIGNKTDDSAQQGCHKIFFFMCVLILLSIPWLPMVLYTFLTQETNSNAPTAATLTVSIGGYQPLFQTTATKGRSILPISEADLESLIDSFGRHTEAGLFLREQKVEDMSLIKFDGVSLSTWGISKHSLNNLYYDLVNSVYIGQFQLVVEVRFKRNPDEEHYSDITGSFPVNLRQPAYTEAWEHLRNNINPASNSSEVVAVNAVFPRFIHLGRFSEVSPEPRIFEGHHGMRYSNLSLKYFRDNNPYASWWELQEVMRGSVFHYEENGGISVVPAVFFITFNDKITTISFLSILKSIGIITLYTGVIWAISGVVRGMFTENHATLMFRELENVDPLLRLVEALYNMSHQKNMENQRFLYGLLMKLYADPKRLKEFTRCADPKHLKEFTRCANSTNNADTTPVKAPEASGHSRLEKKELHKSNPGSSQINTHL